MHARFYVQMASTEKGMGAKGLEQGTNVHNHVNVKTSPSTSWIEKAREAGGRIQRIPNAATSLIPKTSSWAEEADKRNRRCGET